MASIKKEGGVRTNNDHIEYILGKVNELFPPKYLDGAARHRGKLWRKNSDDFLTEEILDFLSYHFTGIEQKLESIAKLDAALEASDWGMVIEARNILTIGNPEGIPEEET